MNINDHWQKAIENTQIIRPRVKILETHVTTKLPYIFLSELSGDKRGVSVKKGVVFVERPSLVLPLNIPRFEGFDFQEELDMDEDNIVNFLLVRGISFPSLKYNNKTNVREVFDGSVKDAISRYSDELAKKEDCLTGLIFGVGDCWQFSVLIFVCSSIARSSENDIRRLLEDFRKYKI